MIIQVNGENREVAAGLSVERLLQELGIGSGRVVVELNRDVISREAHGTTFLKEGDRVEVVHFVGGG